ncbi:MAG: hypothetical protein NZL83_01160 [Candidatus Absconditabacterales bacterium]|nr:hypothetical protein [Candidatus Absconditabacterales bacterium]
MIASALQYNPILYRLDIPPEICIINNTHRPREPHKFPTEQAQIDHVASLNTWIAQYHHHTDDVGYVFHQRLFETYQGEKYRLTAFSCG